MANPSVMPHEAPRLPELRKGVLVRFAQLVFQIVVTGALMFLCAGSVNWWPGWLYLAVTVVTIGATAVWVLPRNPEVIVARGKLHRDTATFDKVIIPLLTLCTGAIYVVGALDNGRYGWAPLSRAWSLTGAVLVLVAMIPVAGAMAANRNLETTVRVQTERGHRVASTGPYRFVRHPMYVGSLVQMPAIALVLGSRWALVPAAAAMACIVVRTAFEDRTLRRELPGYEAFIQHTRYRLIPGLW